MATSAFRQTELGQLVQQIDRLRSSGRISDRELRDFYNRAQRVVQNRHTLRSTLSRTPIGGLIDQVERYGRGTLKETLLSAIFNNLGPLGGLLQGLIRPRGIRVAPTTQGELDIAAEMLRMFGYNVSPPGASRIPVTMTAPAATPTQSAGSLEHQVQEATDLLEFLGFTVTPPAPELSQPPVTPTGEQPSGIGPRPATGSGVPDASPESQGFTTEPPGRERTGKPRRMKVQDIPGRVRLWVDGREFTVPEGDPIITGEMVPVESSNVHSIGFIWNGATPEKGTLKVRFLDKRKGAHRSGKGATYHYFDVHPLMFLAFQNAASKGKWVWDNLRIRGTVSGHQRRYQLARISANGYVPRAAVRLGNEEWYLPRTVRGANGRQYKSELGAQLVRRMDDARPNDGSPNRGAPNRGM